MGQIDAVVFDLDGTLIDSLHRHSTAEVVAAQQMGISTDAIDWAQFRGVEREAIWQTIAPGQEALAQTYEPTINKVFQDSLSDPDDPLLPIPGAPGFMSYVLRHIGQIAQATNSERSNLDAVNDYLGWTHLFQTTVAFEEAGRGKPYPDPYAEIARRLQTDPSRMVAVEDTPTGIVSARNAGYITVGITTSSSEIELAAQADPHVIIGSYRQLAHLLVTDQVR